MYTWCRVGCIFKSVIQRLLLDFMHIYGVWYVFRGKKCFGFWVGKRGGFVTLCGLGCGMECGFSACISVVCNGCIWNIWIFPIHLRSVLGF